MDEHVSGGPGGKDGRGGNVKLSTGAMGEVFDVVVQKLRKGLVEGGVGNTLIASGTGSGAPAGDIIFNVGNLQVLRIDPDGKFFYKGEKIVDNADVALVLRGWLGYCLVVMNSENRVRFEGEARIAELEAQLRAAEKELDARATDSDLADVFANSQAKSNELDGWRDWAQQVIGVALVDAAASRFRIDKKIVDLESKLEVVTEQRDARVKDAGELRSHEHWLKEARSILKDWREWAASCIGQTYAGEADSWLRVRVDDRRSSVTQRELWRDWAIEHLHQYKGLGTADSTLRAELDIKLLAGAAAPLALTVEEILFVRDAFQAAKRSSPYGLSP